MRILKIKSKDGKITINYQKENNAGSFDEFSITSSEQATPEFYENLQDLRQYVIEMCELSWDDLESIKVTGISFSFAGNNDTMGTTITAQKTLSKSNSPLNLNTPHKIESYYAGSGDPKQLLPDDCVDSLQTVIECAIGFINGKRAQSDLFEEAA